MKFTVPKEILSQHVAVLGKTGSGKTSTAKLLVEQVVADGARVCILDPIKSDWWGLTSSADGKRAGLPFHILGGPRGHVPLHASAGKVIGEIVATGALPLSIVDMADFEPGGQAKFFKDFAPTLLRKMRGIVYLVIEEAHIFAPKERSGWGDENLSIHWAKTLATAGRSKGVRLVLVTQRTQALHNALLGSCDTMIAHRLTAPADQEPVVKWLKANTSKEVLEQVSSSLASLKTGDAWLCSGEAKRFEVVHFPRIATYDNTATPTGDGDTREIKTAAVDQEKLRTLIGEEVEKAKADDPRELRKTIAALKADAELLKKKASVINSSPAPAKVVEKPVLKDNQIAALDTAIGRMEAAIEKAATLLTKPFGAVREQLGTLTAAVKAVRQPALPMPPQRDNPTTKGDGRRVVPSVTTARPASVPAFPAARVPPSGGNSDGAIGKGGDYRMLIALAQYPDGLSDSKLAILSRIVKRGGSFRTYLSKLRQAGYVDGDRGRLVITAAGLAAAGDFEPLPTGDALIGHWQRELGDSGARKLFDALVAAYPNAMSRAEAAAAANMEMAGGSFRTYLSKLKVMGLIETTSGNFHAAEDLFS